MTTTDAFEQGNPMIQADRSDMFRPLITLTTDFGTQDGFVGAMKGRILSLCPDTTILDLTHEIPPQDLIAARFALQRALREFTIPAVHIAVIDPKVGSDRPALAAETKAGFLVGPDNGIFSGVLEEFPPSRIAHLYDTGPHWQRHSSFDGLHCFAPAGACLAFGWDLEQIGKRVENCKMLAWEKPQPVPTGWAGVVLAFDRFGNAITNLPGEKVRSGDTLRVGNHTLPLVPHYSAGEETETGAFLINSDSLVEIAVWLGSARKTLALQPGDHVILTR